MEFQCFKCSKLVRVNGVGDFARHLRSNHIIRNGEKLICAQDGCMRTFSLMNSLLRHIHRDHTANAVRYVPAEHDAENQEHSSDDDDDGGDNNDQENQDDDEDDNFEDARQAEVECMENFGVNDLKRIAASMIMKLKSLSSVPYSAVQTAIARTKTMFCDTISSLRHRTLSVMQNHGLDINAEDIVELTSLFESCKNPFVGIETPKQQMDYMINNMKLVPPVERAIGVRYDQRMDRQLGHEIQKSVTETFQYVPVLDVLKLVLNPKLRNLIENEEFASPGYLKGYQDGLQYQQHEIFRNHPHALRFQLYYDDVEVTNPLGSKTGIHKLGLFYYSIQNLPQHLNSSMSSVYLLAACYTNDLKKYGFKKILDPFLDDMKELESQAGVQLTIDDQEVNVHGTLVSFSGDTLAAHEVLGFLSPSANKLCRLCKGTRGDIQIYFTEKDFELRTVEDHDESVQIALQIQRGDSDTGIRNECPLNVLQNFHCITNFNLDIMHDLQEGVCPYEVKLLLHRFISIDKFFTAGEFNQRLHSFQYAYSDRKNKPSTVLPDRIRNLTDHKLGQKAAQMWCLIRMLPLLIGDKIPLGNAHYELLLLLLRCLDIIYGPLIAVAHTVYLEHLVQAHHSQFKAMFPDQRFINKHHHMIHYGTCNRMCGPLIPMQCLKYELKHTLAKRLAHVNCNFKNICKSVATKYRVHQSAMWSEEGGPWIEFQCTGGYMTPVANLDGSEAIYQILGLDDDSEVFVATHVTLFGTEYKPQLYPPIGWQDGLPEFGKIASILIFGSSSKSVKFVVKKYQNIGFSVHYHAYGIEDIEGGEYSITTVDDLFHHHIPLSGLSSYKADSPIYLCPRHSLVHL